MKSQGDWKNNLKFKYIKVIKYKVSRGKLQYKIFILGKKTEVSTQV